MKYAEYLKTDEWQAKRRVVLKRDDYRCVACNSKVKLQVHHRKYDPRGTEKLIDLYTLCAGCHHMFHIRKQSNAKRIAKQRKKVKAMEQKNIREGKEAGHTKLPGGTHRRVKSCIVPKSQFKAEIIGIGGKGMRSDGQ